MIEMLANEGVAVLIALILREAVGLLRDHRAKVQAETKAISAEENDQ